MNDGLMSCYTQSTLLVMIPGEDCFNNNSSGASSRLGAMVRLALTSKPTQRRVVVVQPRCRSSDSVGRMLDEWNTGWVNNSLFDVRLDTHNFARLLLRMVKVDDPYYGTSTTTAGDTASSKDCSVDENVI